MELHYGSQLVLQDVPDDVAKKVLHACHVVNPKYEQALRHSPHAKIYVPRFLVFADETKDGLAVPRGFPLGDFLSSDEEVVLHDNTVDAHVSFPSPKMDLNIVQNYILHKIMPHADEDPSGCFLAVVPTSKGKTIACLELARRLEQKTLVVVHLKSIYKGWMDECRNYLGLQKQDVGELSEGKWRVGKQVTIGMMQTIRSKFHLWKNLRREFGMIIVDEVQIAPCNTMTKILDTSPAKYRLGVTATETRKDNLHKVLFLYFGHPFLRVPESRARTLSAFPISEARVVHTNFDCEYGQDYNKFLDALTKDADRNKLIIQEVLEEEKRGGICLVVTNRIAHAHYLFDEFSKHVPSAMYKGGLGEEAFAEVVDGVNSKQVKVLVVVDKAISLGANIHRVDRLFITVPYANQEIYIQLAGRVKRVYGDKKDAKIILFLDGRIPRIMQLFGKYVAPAFRKMKVLNWIDKEI